MPRHLARQLAAARKSQASARDAALEEELAKLRVENARLKNEVRQLTTRANDLCFQLCEEHNYSSNQCQKLAVMRLKLKAAHASLHNLAAMATEQATCLERGGLLDGR